jgi:hypothetical protein
MTPAMALGLTDYPWSIGELLDAALATDQVPQKTPRIASGGSG